jgi:hypothetical protein
MNERARFISSFGSSERRTLLHAGAGVADISFPSRTLQVSTKKKMKVCDSPKPLDFGLRKRLLKVVVTNDFFLPFNPKVKAHLNDEVDAIFPLSQPVLQWVAASPRFDL